MQVPLNNTAFVLMPNDIEISYLFSDRRVRESKVKNCLKNDPERQ